MNRFASTSLLLLALLPSAANADILHRFVTGDSNPPPNDDGYDASLVTITLAPNIIAPATGVDLAAGSVGLNRFWNSEWAGFTLSSANGPDIDNATEFATGYFTWTVAATAGQSLNLSSLTFNSAPGGTSNARGFDLYAAVNGGSFSFGSTPLLSIAAETGTRATPTPRTIDLSGPAYQDVSSITFRYYPRTPATGNSIDFTAMTVNGSVVPEPSAFLAFFGGCAVLAGFRRRQRSA
jgi:hypothetical protein